MSNVIVDLSSAAWTVEGWRQWDWMLPQPMESMNSRQPDIGPVPVSVPGSVRTALVNAGVVPAPEYGVASRQSEFLENRHWIFRTTLAADATSTDAATRRRTLSFEGLDGAGHVLIDGEPVAEFGNTFLPVHVDVTDVLRGHPAELAIVFSGRPLDLGQIGRTSQRRDWKPRFSYGWDWTPRIVQIGISGGVSLRAVPPFGLAKTAITTRYTGDEHDAAAVRVRTSVPLVDRPAGLALSVSLTGPRVDVRQTFPLGEGELQDVEVIARGAVGWMDDAELYTTDVHLVDAAGESLDHSTARVGFRRIEWRPTPGAPAGSEPWLCVVDGVPTFLQGVNWVPIRPDFADVPDDFYRQRLHEYHRMGVNLIRVWGGAGRERDLFYDLCDELRIFVWQEMPLCSSGVDNVPPDDDEFVDEFRRVAEHLMGSLVHHPCVIAWCGGNELSGDVDGAKAPGDPLTFAHPALAEFRSAAVALDDDRKIIPTSPSGPMFARAASDDPGSIYEDVHGPWDHVGDEAVWREYWANDTAMMRSEVGIVGATDRDLLEHFDLLRLDGAEQQRLWAHSASWWMSPADDGSNAAIHESQARQARLLREAARASKSRFPRCGGFLIWMGHDAFPCPVSLAVLDYWGRPKPAAAALGEVFRAVPGSL